MDFDSPNPNVASTITPPTDRMAPKNPLKLGCLPKINSSRKPKRGVVDPSDSAIYKETWKSAKLLRLGHMKVTNRIPVIILNHDIKDMSGSWNHGL